MGPSRRQAHSLPAKRYPTMKRPLFACCWLLAAGSCTAWPGVVRAAHWQPRESDNPPSLGDEATISHDDLLWVLERDSPDSPDAGVEGTENDSYEALDPATTPPPGPSGGREPVPVPEPSEGWLVGGAWLILRRRRQPGRA